MGPATDQFTDGKMSCSKCVPASLFSKANESRSRKKGNRPRQSHKQCGMNIQLQKKINKLDEQRTAIFENASSVNVLKQSKMSKNLLFFFSFFAR